MPAAAHGAVRYAEPGGNGPEPCLQADPCEVHDAATGHVPADVVNGDEIVLLPGDYSIAQEIDLIDQNLNFHGQAGPRPRISSTGNTALFSNSTGTQISHVQIEQSGSFSGLHMSSGSGGTVEDVRVHTSSPTNFSFTCQLLGTVLMRNSVCWNTSAAGAAVGISTSGGSGAVTLRNVTAVSTASTNSYGIYYDGSSGSTIAVTATNVIARGVTKDILASASSASVSITLDHSNYATEFETGGGTVTDPGTGTNQTAAPLFLDAATGGFHETTASPTVNNGITDLQNGTADIDGEARATGTTDIGADEFVATDNDVDGIPNGPDACPSGATGWTSSTANDYDRDGCRDSDEDTDDDNDLKADGADSCQAGDTGWISVTGTDHDGDGCRDAGEDLDDDNDLVADGSDGCAAGDLGWTSDAGNDHDFDGCRDAGEDTDDDNDTVVDGSDSCARGDTAWTSDSTTDHDADGCRDVGVEDSDDDNDSKTDGTDTCPAGDLGWTSNAVTDNDSDGCRDAGEDADDDNDTVNDTTDNCALTANADQANNEGDAQGDVCDPDDDNDTVNDASDNCALTANADQANNDGDTQGDACDADDDNDGVDDGADACPTKAGPSSNGGCPESDIKDTTAPETTISAHPAKRVFKRKTAFDLSSDDATAHFECSLDGAAFSPCGSSVQFRVKYGKHTFAARAVDPAGNADATPASWAWKVKHRR